MRRHLSTKGWSFVNCGQVHLPRKQCLIIRDRHQHVAYIHILDTYRRNDNRRMINDRRTNKGRRKENAWRLLFKYIYLSLYCKLLERVVQEFACERMLKTEHKLHILTPLLWPSRCVFLVLLDVGPEVFGSTPSGVSEVPLGRVWPSLPHLVSKPLGVCWQLLWDPNSTELNNNSTPTRSPTGSLKSNV